MTNLQALALAAVEHLRQGIRDMDRPRWENIGTAKAPKWQPVKSHFGQARLNASHVATKCPTAEARAWMLADELSIAAAALTPAGMRHSPLVSPSQLPFDPIEEARRHWLARWPEPAQGSKAK